MQTGVVSFPRHANPPGEIQESVLFTMNSSKTMKLKIVAVQQWEAVISKDQSARWNRAAPRMTNDEVLLSLFPSDVYRGILTITDLC